MFIVIHGSWEGFRKFHCFQTIDEAILHGDSISFDEEDYESGWVKILETDETDGSAEIVWQRYFDE